MRFKQRGALQIKFRYSDIPISIGLSNIYRNIGLTYLSDFNYRTSINGLLIVQDLSDLLKYWISDWQIQETIDYRILDLGLNLLDYQIADSEKIINCPPLDLKWRCKVTKSLHCLKMMVLEMTQLLQSLKKKGFKVKQLL
jgi:hypothetical protein